MNRYTETWGDGTQYVCELIQRSSDGQYGVIEYEGLVRNIPRIGRAKRTAEALDDDEEEDEAIVAVDRPEVAHLWDDQVRGRTTARIIKKKRTSAVASTRKPTAPPSRMSGPNVSAPTRRSTRNTATVGRTRQHSTIPEETSAHDVRRGMRNQPVVKDEEQDISDLMNQFEINSNAGTGTCHIFAVNLSTVSAKCGLQNQRKFSREKPQEPRPSAHLLHRALHRLTSIEVQA